MCWTFQSDRPGIGRNESVLSLYLSRECLLLGHADHGSGILGNLAAGKMARKNSAGAHRWPACRFQSKCRRCPSSPLHFSQQFFDNGFRVSLLVRNFANFMVSATIFSGNRSVNFKPFQNEIADLTGFYVQLPTGFEAKIERGRMHRLTASRRRSLQRIPLRLRLAVKRMTFP